MDVPKGLLHQFRRNGLIYSVSVVPSDEYKLPNIPALHHLKSQFLDIAGNHAAFIAEELDRQQTHQAAAELRTEYFADREPVPAT